MPACHRGPARMSRGPPGARPTRRSHTRRAAMRSGRAPGLPRESGPRMRNATKLGWVFGFVIAGCSTAPPRTEKGAFKVEDVVQTTDDAIRVQVNHREVPLQEMPMASLLAGLPMAGLA